MFPTRILLADDDEEWRRDLRLLLDARPEWQIIWEVSDGLEAVRKTEEFKPDILLLDVSIPDLNGIEVTRRLRQVPTSSKIVFVSMDNRPDAVEIALSAGAQGYVNKANANSDLLPAIDAVLQGERFVSSTLNGHELGDNSNGHIARIQYDEPIPQEHGARMEEASRGRDVGVGLFLAVATLLTAAIVVSGFYGFYRRPESDVSIQAAQQIDQLKQQNSALTLNLSQLTNSVTAQRGEIQTLRAQLGNAGNGRANSEQNVQLPGESQNQEKLLADARDEVARTNESRANDEASLTAQQARITELSDKLRVASATLEMERQLAAAGQNLRELMVARQLHVIDIRDTDPSGNPSDAFGRVFLTEGKSLTFYAFDLNVGRPADAKRNFQVWGVPDANAKSSRSLGFLQADNEASGRWVLKVDNPDLVKDINSAFVTVEPATGGKQPSGQKMLYAYLGEANHP
jgi:DNA-binding NarL/FixJ family response regulator